MTQTEIPPAAQAARRLLVRLDLIELDMRRNIRQLRRDNFTEAAIASMTGVSQPVVHEILHVAERDPEPLNGFSGATPLEICQRYAAGDITRDQLIDELARFPYKPIPETDGYDWLMPDTTGTWMDLSIAEGRGLIDTHTYGEVLRRRFPEETTALAE